MENTFRIGNLKFKGKSFVSIFLTLFFSLIMVLHSLGSELFTNIVVNLISSFIGVSGGYYAAIKFEKRKEIEKALNIKKNILSIIQAEIESNKTIFILDYIDEKDKEGFLDLSERQEFQTKEWDMFKFKIYTEGIDFSNHDGFQELVELYKRFESIKLHKRSNVLVTEKNKNEILCYINDNIWYIKNKLIV